VLFAVQGIFSPFAFLLNITIHSSHACSRKKTITKSFSPTGSEKHKQNKGQKEGKKEGQIKNQTEKGEKAINKKGVNIKKKN
jgi:hypothetical protein